MRRLLSKLAPLLIALIAPSPALADDAGIAIVGADVLTMTDPKPLRDRTVLIAGDQIRSVSPRGSTSVPKDWRVIDGRGKTLMPGLVDMHVHLANEPGRPGDAAQRALAVMLAHGVTTARSMAGAPAHPALRDRIARGELAGPRLLLAAPALNLNTVKTPEAARAAVAAAKTGGFDLIKSHHLTDVAVWQAVQDEARRQGLPVSGHVANPVGLERALTAGQQVEHLDGAIHALLPADSPERAMDFAQIPPPDVISRAKQAGVPGLDALAARVAAARSFQTPTLALFEKLADIDRPAAALRSLPEMRWAPEPALEAWTQQRAALAGAGFTAADGRAFVELRRAIVHAYAKAGVPLMAGSDTAQAFHIWGPGLIDEIEAMARAGLSSFQALRTATIVPRDWLRTAGREAGFGTIEPGARADLVLLPADPLADLNALRRPALVIAAGRAYDRAALDELLAQAARDAKAPPPAPPARPLFVMRHLPAESGADPALTEEGRSLAARLADRLAGAGLVAIFATDTRRARETAAPLAARLGLAVTPYDPRRPDALAAAVSQLAGPALIVGHSNTVPELVTALGGSAPAPLAHDDFGRLWRIEQGRTTEDRLPGR